MQMAVITWFEKQHRLIAGLAVAAALLAIGALIYPGLYEEYSIASFVGGDNPEFQRFQEFIDTFGGSELAVVAVKGPDALEPATLRCLNQLVDQAGELRGVQRASAVSQIPRLMRSQWGRHPLVSGTLVSADRRTAAVVLQMTSDVDAPSLRRHTVGQLRRIVEQATGDYPALEIILTGPYVTMFEMFEYVRQDLAKFSIFVVLLMLAVLYLLIGSWRPAAFIIGVGAASTLITLGITIVLQLNMSLATQMVVIMVSVLAIATCVHLAVAYREAQRLTADSTAQRDLRSARGRGTTRRTLSRMMAPCTAVIVTSAAGFAAVTVSDLKPIKLFGYIMALGLLLSLLIAFAAVFLLAQPGRVPVDPRNRFHVWLADGLASVARVSLRYKKTIVVGFTLLALVLAVPVPGLKFESNFVNNFRKTSSVRQGYEFVEQNLAPMNSVELVVRAAGEASAVNLHTLAACKQLSAEAVARHEPIKKALSFADLLSLVSPNPPSTEAELQLRLAAPGLLSRFMGQDLLAHFVTADRQAMRISLRVQEAPSVREKISLAEDLQRRAQVAFGGDYQVELTGLYYFYATLIAGLLREQHLTFAISLMAVFATTALFFRSWKIAALGMVPNLFPMLACLGLMGYLGIPVNMATSMMLSIALGIAIDDTIHYVWRYRRELRRGMATAEALENTHRSVGQACVFTTLVIAGGFWILCYSRFLPTAYFGALVGLTMLTALASDLLLLPTLLAIFNPVKPRPAWHSSKK